jgi:hypothetical protein
LLVVDTDPMATDHFRSPFDARCELMLDVTRRTLECDPDLKLCEGLRLIEATHKAIARLAPGSIAHFEDEVLPQLRSVLMERFGVSELPAGPLN